MKSSRLFLVSLAILAGSLPASAHHSFAAFDLSKTVKLEATVKEFQWTNPHSWMQVVVLDPKTKGSKEWALEMTNVALLVRTGWRPATVKQGDKVVLEIHPRRDGGTGGSLMRLTRNDGKMFDVLGQGGTGKLR